MKSVLKWMNEWMTGLDDIICNKEKKKKTFQQSQP